MLPEYPVSGQREAYHDSTVIRSEQESEEPREPGRHHCPCPGILYHRDKKLVVEHGLEHGFTLYISPCGSLKVNLKNEEKGLE